LTEAFATLHNRRLSRIRAFSVREQARVSDPPNRASQQGQGKSKAYAAANDGPKTDPLRRKPKRFKLGTNK